MGDDALDLLLGDARELNATGLTAIAQLYKSVALAKEVLGALLVEHDTRVHALRYSKRDARWDVGLDAARNDIRARTLRAKHHVEARGTRLLPETLDGVLDSLVLALLRDEVRKLVDDDDD